MSELDLAELRKKAEAATAGPWRVETDTTLVWGRCDPEDSTTYGMGIPLTEVRIGQQRWKGPSLSYDEAEATAQFIAAANPAVVLALIDRIEKAEAQLYGTTRDDEGKPAIGEPSYAHQWALDTLSGAENGRRFIWGQRNLAKSYLNMEAEISRLRALLARAGKILSTFGEGADLMDDNRLLKHEGVRAEYGALGAARSIAAAIEKELGDDRQDS